MNNPGMNIRHPKARGEWAELRFMTRASELRFRVSKPWGDSYPYDIVTDHHGLFRRIQVKCTICKRQHSYVCTLCASHVPYRPGQLDFFAAYIIPIRATNNQPAIVLSPHLKNSKYSKYKEAWHLLQR